MDWHEVGSRIAEARQERRWSQTELAGELGWERTRLNKVESGTQRLTALDLVDVARALGRRLDWFVLPRPDAVGAYRGKKSAAWEPSALRAGVEALAADVLAVDGSEGLGARPSPMGLGSDREAEDAAAKARRAAGLEASQAVGGMAEFAARLGLLVFARPGGELAEDGAYLPVDDYGIALVNSTRKPGRRRLAAAHELGHHVAGDGLRTDRDIDEPADGHEQRVDRFARAFLLPEHGIVDRWQELVQTHDVRTAAVVVASRFQVDMATLATRLHRDLGAIDNPTAAEIRATTTTRGDFVEHGLRNPDDLSGWALPLAYQRAVIAAYKAERVNAARAVDLLHGTFTEADLPPLPPLVAGRVWEIVD